jgi:hypothetical protein
MIRAARKEDAKKLEGIYEKSVYRKIPLVIGRALEYTPERVLVVEKHGQILGTVLTGVCGYNHLWLSYIVFDDFLIAEALIEYLIKIKEKRDIEICTCFYRKTPRSFVFS